MNTIRVIKLIKKKKNPAAAFLFRSRVSRVLYFTKYFYARSDTPAGGENDNNIQNFRERHLGDGRNDEGVRERSRACRQRATMTSFAPPVAAEDSEHAEAKLEGAESAPCKHASFEDFSPKHNLHRVFGLDDETDAEEGEGDADGGEQVLQETHCLSRWRCSGSLPLNKK